MSFFACPASQLVARSASGHEVLPDAEPFALYPGQKRFTVSTWARSFMGKDRKSTRLNSSHQIISYAVFCLKKKKNTDVVQIGSQITAPGARPPEEHHISRQLQAPLIVFVAIIDAHLLYYFLLPVC